MALSTNQVSGLASGFDWRTMIDKLIAVDHKSVDAVESRKKEYESRLSEWQSFNTKLLALKTAAGSLKDPDDFYVYTAEMSTDSATVDGDDLLSVSASSDAVCGTYTVQVTQLATAQKLSSNPFSSRTDALGSAYAGDIVINGKVVTVSSTDSLADVANNINSANTGTDRSGVTASIVNYGTHDYRLILTSDATGEDGISLLNGASSNLVQKFGWKDQQTAQIKNSITDGAQSDRFKSHNVSVKSLLGLTTGETSTGSLTIGGTAVTINLSTMSLDDIKNAINSAGISGVTASVISQSSDGTIYYRLQIDGTQTFVDENNILNTLGILDHTSDTVTGKVSGNSMTTEGAYITKDTLLTDIDGYNTFTSGGYAGGGDYLALTGTDTSGTSVGTVNFDISSATTVQDLLDEIEDTYGNVIAYVTADGKIRVDDLSGGSSLAVNLADHIQDANSSLEFVTADADFGDAATRNRQITAGQDSEITIDGVTVTASSNVIDDVISGVTIDLLKADAATTVTLEIGHDLDAVKSNIQDFVDKYNTVMSYINTQFSYNEDTGETGGILFGDSTLRSVKDNLTTLLTQTIWGVDSAFSIPALVGIEMGDDLQLSIDDDKLTGYLKSNFSDVMSLFVGQGVASSGSLAYVSHTRDSEAGEYTVHINRAATRATETGNVDLSSGGADETLTITQGNNTATITITTGMTLADIKNAINSELQSEYTRVVVGDRQLKEDDGTTVISSETTWDDIYGASLQNADVISFSGTDRDGGSIFGSYTISDVTSDTVQGLLSAIEDAFSSSVTASIDTSGRMVITDKYTGYSQVSLEISEPDGRGLDFGTIDVTPGAGDGSQEGRYALTITADDDGSNHLVLRNDDYGSATFSISQDTTDGNYDQVIHTATANTTTSSSGDVYVTAATLWNDVYGADVADNDTITISGKARDGVTDISGTYTISDITTDTVNGLLTAIESAYSAQGTTVDAFVRDGRIFVEDTTAGSSSISLTLTCNNEGGGSLSLGTFDQSTERDLDLGLINGDVTGLDVAGTINGEDATGSGQLLTGDDGNANTDGLAVSYTGTSNEVDAGTITLTLGFAELLDRTLFDITDSYEGYLNIKETALQDRIDGFEEQIQEMEARLDRKMEEMINRFIAMEAAISAMQNQSQWLTGQINSAASGWK